MEIAGLRGLTYVLSKSPDHIYCHRRIGVEEIVPAQKLDQIMKIILESGPSSLTSIKEKLGADISFGEIRAVFSIWRNAGT